ncbi:DUF1917-domain-containing protein [Pleomassaria siparia CBS 279.74]|uniref:DUF1917-domain-containing protein n=1 Tax=Pleomassaria siparia CBS 279.74 TaxID=1314801 RepID=A0A6G1KFG6_9PLEO|nr:DUF1917-domain-containing protein [Pleomassaria siparia CBS 279.74]
MAEEDMVSGDGWFSDDSSFYGDEENQQRLLSLCQGYNTKSASRAHGKDLNALLSRKRAMPPLELSNAREKRPDSWQRGESVADFLARVPPLTTSTMTFEWIWVYNPFHDSHGDPKRPMLNEFIPRGNELLEQALLTRKAIRTENSHSPKGTITRMLNEQSKQVQQRICDLATETNVLSGKWMLFPTEKDVTRVWGLIVEAVINNRLGPGAKVAPSGGNSKDRLICVYTKDFRGTDDVLRVIRELRSMGLVSARRGIYYKSDPYTYLNIYGSNAAQYGLQASLYSSQKMFAEADFPKSPPVPHK